MAFDFLKLSPTYIASLRSSSREATLARRAAIVERLSDTYKVGRNRVADTLAQLQQQFPDLTVSTLNADVALYRTTFRYLAGTEQERAQFLQDLEKRNQSTSAIPHLHEDGIERWSDVERMQREQETPPEPVMEHVQPILRSEILVMAPELLDRVLSVASDMQCELERARTLIGDLTATKERLQQSSATAQELVLVLHEKLSAVAKLDADALVARYPSLKHLLASGLESTQQPAIPKSPEHPELPKIDRSIKKNRPVFYERPFLDPFAKLVNGERRQVIKAMELLSTHGHNHPSLKTQRLAAGTPAPEGSWFSRGSDELRIVWMPDPTNLRVLFLFRKGDRRFHRSEK